MDRSKGSVGRWLEGLTLDLTRLKQINTFRSAEMLVRYVALGFGSLALDYVNGHLALFYFFVVYASVLTFQIWLVQRCPNVISGWRYLIVRANMAGEGIAYIGAVIFLWYRGDPFHQFVSLVLLLCMMLSAVTRRASEPALRRLDFFHVWSFIVAVMWWAWTMGPDRTSALLYGGPLVLTFVYHALITLEVAKTRLQLEEARRKEVDTERMSAMGALTGGVAHDFNNLLTVILGNIELQREVSDPAMKEELIGEAEQAARRGADLTQQLLAYSRRARLEPETIAPELILEEVVSLVTRLLPETVRLAPRFAQDLPPIHVDRTKLQTAVMNLIVNARDAVSSGGLIELDVGETAALNRPTVSIEIRDDGTGISPDLIEKVKEPFFTTKPMGQGSGLGLSMAYGFAEQSGGRLDLASGPDRGTTVTIHLPALPKLGNQTQAADATRERNPKVGTGFRKKLRAKTNA